ncbi:MULTISPECIES: MFS transporter [unclassified Sphingopyxis]|uniref:MFS transporter n=1 Tax=unclassified Sphingopyxis TaxID=2614943 RepID=UPI0007308798|nr:MULTISPECIES: MFS transporter [unclassified Sphingopyxis]KTE25369.1 MFS transporter [Sphingopyxis sp. H057]KTE53390.1 MFS transporter [Sphingopyxis sp. H073]KTE55981.1 MFS transporter [Sphingopyxis sp. H071]KTE60933.1 MFS transporter [Sphingopyxis sp. H100]KTE62906.1 MFS transporter [Sphingopyxis sp. H107]
MTDAAAAADHAAAYQPTAKDIRMVIAASSAGTIFEWYDFFIYGTLAAIIGKAFFPSDNATLEILLVWAGFAVGFGFRPLGAVLFGFLGDRLGRKYTFLVTVTLMGIATAGVGMIPSAATIGFTAPVIVLLLRILQGLALGGEYGGAAVYVAEHSPPEKRGFYTSFIQASVVGGFVLSLIVVLGCKAMMPDAVWESWGWRVPFLLSLILLAISLWMRLKLSESPVFQAMKAEGEIAKNPIKESFTYPGNPKRIFVALFGIAAGLTVIWYTAMFSGLSFLKGPMKVEDTAAEIIVGIAAALGMGFFLLAGRLSDRIGRKKPIVWGYAATLVLLFPLFWLMGSVGNPALTAAAEKAPVVVTGSKCSFDPFAQTQETACGKTLGELTKLGVPYQVVSNETGFDSVKVMIGDREVASEDPVLLKPALEAIGYGFDKQIPAPFGMAVILVALLGLSALSGFTYGPVAALLSEMFPPHVRYSSLSIPYHLGTGYFGGFLPLIASFIVAKTGNAYAGLWYTWVVVLVAFLVSVFLLKEPVEGQWDKPAPSAGDAA